MVSLQTPLSTRYGQACWSDHDEIVLRGGRDFWRALGVFLATDFRKVGCMRRSGLREQVTCGTVERDALHPLPADDERKEAFNRIDFEARNERDR